MVKDESGQSLVEMALVLPVLLLLLVGIVDVGRLIYSYSHMHLATQETVRLGGLGEGDVEMRSFARSYVSFQDSSLLTVDISPGEGSRESGEYVTVKLSYPFQPVTPFAEQIFTGPLQIQTDSTIRVE
ncbi:TadE/TadG family type IV pilus assembly protein [Halobacillus yeomjeoni]|uniref:Pilus assembly protein n=1 Tax=Halobacillus yeomjeoni TaxID=311194 RepID=A0A931MU62_9BACI|nr:TadE/TadG family type IV pilus assembly protein [Halobacillus yeomjeoni]MBH0229186.1 pilus assembly protein [Halobacillus yeomjeoni]